MVEHPRAAIVAAGALSATGLGWRGLGRALLSGALAPRPSSQLAASHPGTLASEVGAIPADKDVGDAKSRRLMSRSAHLAAVAMRGALEEAGWSEGRDRIGCFLGLGASGGPMEELAAILRASVREGRVDPARFCREGLASAHPLLAFHLLSNFTLCHGSIAFGVGGPNRAFYSRGAGTVTAISEAIWALAEGDCERALAGGADSGLHQASFVEMYLEGFCARGWIPGEGAAWMALCRDAERPLAFVEGCAVAGDAASVWAKLGGAPLAILVPWGPPARDALSEATRTARRVDLSACLGDPLAAGPALGCCAALDLLVAQEAPAAGVLASGADGEVAGVRLVAGGGR